MMQLFNKYFSEIANLKLNQFLTICLLTLSQTAILKFIETYIYSDWTFLIYLLVLISLDTFTGVWKAIKAGTVSSTSFGGVIVKIILYGIALMVTHTLTHFEVEGSHPAFLDLIDDFMYSALMVRESISILENIGKISPKLIPSWILKRLKQFDKEGNPLN